MPESDATKIEIKFVPVGEHQWTDDYSYMRELTCKNHPTAKYYTKDPFFRGLHIIELPKGLSMEERTDTGECKCPFRDLVVLIRNGSDNIPSSEV